MSISQFHDISLNVELALGARVKVAYKTVVIRTREGDEERIGEWQDALRTFDLTPALRDQTDLDYLIAFFRSRLGPTFAFKIRDPIDYLTYFEFCGEGNGIRTFFPLTKYYDLTVRPILFPDLPFVVYIGNDVADPSLYYFDSDAALIKFYTPPTAVVHWSGTFQVPVRFQTTQMYTSYAMYQRFEAQILLQEIRTFTPEGMGSLESQPPDVSSAIFPPTFSERSESGPQYDTVILTGASGAEQRIGQFVFPKVAFQVDQAMQSTADMTVLLRFFHAHRGRLVSFLALDYTDFQAINHFFAYADGVSTTYRIEKRYTTNDFTQIRSIHYFQGAVAIYVNDVLVTSVRVVESEQGIDVVSDNTVHGSATVSADGIVTFAFPPALNAALRWTGTFYTPVRFDTDELDISVDGPDVQSWSRISLLEVPTTMILVYIADVG